MEKKQIYTSELCTTFKERFSDLLKEKGVSGSEVARRLGVSKQTVSAWCCGERSPKIAMTQNIATLYGVNPMWLFGYDVPEYGDEENRMSNTDAENSIKYLYRYYGLTNEQKALITCFFKLPKARRDIIGDFVADVVTECNALREIDSQNDEMYHNAEGVELENKTLKHD